MTKPLVIYHDNCADGFGAAFAAWLKLGDDTEYLPQQYNSIDFTHPADIRENVDGREVYILDFSFPRVVMNQIFTDAKRVVWLDHHKTAFEMWGEPGMVSTQINEPACVIWLDNNKSGAMLAWEHFHPDTEIPMLIKHIDDYDRWQFKLAGTKEFNKALWSFAPWSFALWAKLLTNEQDYPETVGHMRTAGAAILRAHNQNVQSVVKGSARECVLKLPEPRVAHGQQLPPSIIGLVANCPPFLTSDVGHALATQSGTFGLCWTLSQTGLIANCSLRSNGDYDVSAIAKAFGGGGHKNAAGFEVPIATLLGWLV